MTSVQRRARPRRRLRWDRLLRAAFVAYAVGYVGGYVYWHFFAHLWGPGPAWAIEILVWAGLPSAFAAGRLWPAPCRSCQERERTIALLEEVALQLIREKRRGLAGERGLADSPSGR